MGIASAPELLDVRARLATVADPTRAPAMQAYMKSTMPFHGVPSTEVRAVVRDVVATHPLTTRDAWESTVRTIYDGATHREERYVALGIARHPRYRAFRDPAALELWRHLVTTGAWWDLVDDVASHHVGDTLRRHPDAARPVVQGWATADDLWLRRTAIICQLGHKDATDLELLAYAVDANVEGTRFGGEFFIRKAIGWALRQHARVDPDWVRSFVAARESVLSGLTRREALKHLGPAHPGSE